MLEILWLLLVAWWSGQQPVAMERRIEPGPEPAVVFEVYAPMVWGDGVVVGAEDRPVYGYASPHRRVYEDAPFYNWGAFDQYCVYENYWPMVRDIRSSRTALDPSCDNGRRTLLLFNEPELGHMSATPLEAVKMLERWSHWQGPIVCCGNFYDRVMGAEYSGLSWFRAFVAAYVIRHGSPPPLAAIHLHVYEFRTLNLPVLEEWRALADLYGWPIYVTESATFPTENYAPDEVAARLPGFLGEVEQVLSPAVLMWFPDFLVPGALGPNAAKWERFNLYAGRTLDAPLTVVGEAWEAWIYR
jgi:hypothetical protein